jgi:hypothetical protein
MQFSSRVALIAILVSLGGVACTGSGTQTSTGAKASALATPAVKQQAQVRSRSSAPHVRMFAGVQSALGALQQFCRGKKCDQPNTPPSRIAIAEGAVMTFAVDSAPDLAVLDVGGTGARRLSLPTGTLMPVPHRLAPGAHRLVLQLRWGTSVGTWAFDVVVRKPGG